MSVKGKKAGLVISWHKSFSILAPWRKGRCNRHTVLDSEVVLTKVKLFNTFHERILVADNSTFSTKSFCELESTKASEMKSHQDDKQSGKLQNESSSDYMSAILSDPRLQRIYKFESEDSGVELPSGANSPSTPTASEQSFVVHSRESSCDSGNSKSDSTSLTDNLIPYAQSSEIKETEVSLDINTAVKTQDNVFLYSEEVSSSSEGGELHKREAMDKDQHTDSGNSSEEVEKMSGELEESSAANERTCFKHLRHYEKQRDEMMSNPFALVPVTSESLEDYMDQCCRISESQQESFNPLGSGLSYLEHICQLIEKISQLQETNLQLQRQICSLQKDSSMAKTKEDFFQQHCSCGAASLAFQDIQKGYSRKAFLSPSVTLSDLSTIPEVTRHPFISTRDPSSEGLTPIPLSRRGLNRRSYTEGEVHFLGDSTEGLSFPQRRFSENYTWGRVKDLVKKTKSVNQSRLKVSSTSLKMSCPQLYMPDLGPAEPAGRQRNSMSALEPHSKFDFPWQQ